MEKLDNQRNLFLDDDILLCFDYIFRTTGLGHCCKCMYYCLRVRVVSSNKMASLFELTFIDRNYIQSNLYIKTTEGNLWPLWAVVLYTG